MTEKVMPSAVNSNHRQWTDKMAMSMSLSHGIHSKVVVGYGKTIIHFSLIS